MRFLKQLDDYSCGPIVVLNILRALGEPATRESHKFLWEMLKTTADGYRGTYKTDLLHMMRSVGIPFKYLTKATIKPVFQHLGKHNQMAAISYNHAGGAHFFLVIPSTSSYCYAINFKKDEAVSRITYRTLYKAIWRSHYYSDYRVWPSAFLING